MAFPFGFGFGFDFNFFFFWSQLYRIEAINFVHCMRIKCHNPRHCHCVNCAKGGQRKGRGGGTRARRQVKEHIWLFFFFLSLLSIWICCASFRISGFLFLFLFSCCCLWMGAWFLTRFLLFILLLLLLSFFRDWCGSSCSGRAPRCSALAGPWLNTRYVCLLVYLFALMLVEPKWRTLEASLTMSMPTIRSANKHYKH